MTKVRAIWIGIGIGTGIGLGMALGLVLFRDASKIAVAWGNANAEHERRLAVEAPFRAQKEKEREAQIAADAIYNEANCKVTVRGGLLADQQVEVITGMQRISKHDDSRGCYLLHFSGGVTRHVERVLRTDNCR